MTDTQKALALKSETSLAEMPMSMEELQKDANLGGKIGLKDISIPYLYVLQSNSPQCNPDNDKYIDGAVAGMFLLTVKDKVFDGRKDGIKVVLCYYERKIMEWIPREQGGGLVGSYPADDPIMFKAAPNERGQLMLPNGHMLMDTAYHYVLVHDLEDNSWTQAIMPLKSTALKVSRKLNSLVSTTNVPGSKNKAPRFLFEYKVTTVKEQKDVNVWSSPAFQQLNLVTKQVYSAAKEYSIVASQNLLARAPEPTDRVMDDVPF